MGAKMRLALVVVSLAVLSCAGCTSQACRPCGPGFLGNIFVAQGFADVDFRDACRAHDHCYTTDCPRKDCDVQFREDMLGACECSSHPALCRLRAWRWYWQVRLGGGLGYWQSQMERGCDCGGSDCCPTLHSADDLIEDIPAPDSE
jgi:hypothetical protein